MTKLIEALTKRTDKMNKDHQKKLEEFDQLFENFFNDLQGDCIRPLGNLSARLNSFRVDVLDKDNYYVVTADLPGLTKEEVSIEYDDQYLTIRARRSQEEDQVEGNYIRRERASGEFRRSFFIDNIETDAIDASFDSGVLVIKLKKEKQNG